LYLKLELNNEYKFLLSEDNDVGWGAICIAMCYRYNVTVILYVLYSTEHEGRGPVGEGCISHMAQDCHAM